MKMKLLLCTFAIFAMTVHAADKPLKVYILVGQSNVQAGFPLGGTIDTGGFEKSFRKTLKERARQENVGSSRISVNIVLSR